MEGAYQGEEEIAVVVFADYSGQELRWGKQVFPGHQKARRWGRAGAGQLMGTGLGGGSALLGAIPAIPKPPEQAQTPVRGHIAEYEDLHQRIGAPQRIWP